METHKMKVSGGEEFTNAAKKAKRYAKDLHQTVEFMFNGVKCLINASTNTEWLRRDYNNSWIMDWKTVGPDCVKKYSAKIQADLEVRTKIRAEKDAKELAQYRRKEAMQRLAFEEKTDGVKLELTDPEGWNKSREANKDGYGGAALDYAEGWAKLMQIEITKGKTVKQCYEYTQEGLGFFGITGFQFGCAVSVLSQTWKYGDELRKVHNKIYGVSEDAEGTVNPAILTLK